MKNIAPGIRTQVSVAVQLDTLYYFNIIANFRFFFNHLPVLVF